eukprot:2043736-Amphidinium_carterae.1
MIAHARLAGGTCEPGVSNHVELATPLAGQQLAGGTREPAVPIFTSKKSEWQIVIGKRASIGRRFSVPEQLSACPSVVLHDDNEITSLSMDCLSEELSSSDEDEDDMGVVQLSLEPTKCPQAFAERGFASESEEWNFHMEIVKHIGEVDTDEARCVSAQVDQ